MIRLAIVFLFLLGIALPQAGPGPAASILVSGPQSRVLYGESMKLIAVARDGSGQARSGDTFTWTSSDSNVLAVDTQGVVTAKMLGFAEIRASIGNLRGAITLQVTPARIVVSPGSMLLLAGERQQYRAAVLDGKGQEIPGVSVQWDIVNAMLRTTVVAAIDSRGNVVAAGPGRFFIRARYAYQGQFSVPFVPYVEGTADLTVRLKPAYTVREIAATGARNNTATLRPRRTLVSVNERGQIAFQGSFDNVSTGLLLHDNSETLPLAVSASPGPVPTGFIYEFQNFSLNDSGEVLTRALVAGAASGLLLASPVTSKWYGVEGMYLGGIEAVGSFFVTRNSLNNSSDALVRATYRLAGEATTYTGLFRFGREGNVELVVSTGEPLPDFPVNFTFENEFGIANDGTIFFRVSAGSDTAIYRQRGFDRPERLVGSGDSVNASRITGFPNTTFPTFYVSGRGDLVTQATLSTNATVLVHFVPGSREARASTFRSLSGVFGVRDGNVLWYGDVGRGVGLQLWKNDGQTEGVLQHNQDFGGEPVVAFDAAAFGPGDEIIALARTRTKPFVLARIHGSTVSPILESGVPIRSSSALSFTSFVLGSKDSQPPLLSGGGDPSNLLEYSGSALQPVVSYGERVPGDVASYGLFNTNSRRSPRGDLYVFVSPYGVGVPNFGVYRWNGGNPEQVLRLNFNWPDGVSQFSGSVHSVSDTGWLLLSGGTSRGHSRLYTFKDGAMRSIATNSGSPEFVTELANSGAVVGWNDAVITDSGRVMAHFRFRSTPNGLFYWDGNSWIEAAVVNSTKLMGLTVTSINFVRAVDENIYASFTLSGAGTALARWAENKWDVLISHEDTLPTGQPMSSIGVFEVNRAGEIVFGANSFSWPVLVKRNAARELALVSYSFDFDTVPTQIVRYVDIDFRDDGKVYFIALDITDRYVLFEATPTASAHPVKQLFKPLGS